MTGKTTLLISIICISAVMFFITLMPSVSPSDITPTIPIEFTRESNVLETISTEETTPESPNNNVEKEVTSRKPTEQDYIVHCDSTTTENSSNIDEEFNDFAQHLQQSNSPDKQLAYILFTSQSDEEHQLELLQSYNKKFSGNKRVLMDIVGLCSITMNHKYCDESLLKQAIELDGDNGALWLQIANFHAAKGNTPATLEAIEKAITATHFNEYYFDKLALFMQTSKGALDVDFSHRAITGLGYHAATSVWISEIAKFCTEEKNYSNRHNQLCLALGKTMSTQNNSLIANAMGLNIQSQIYKKEHNEELHLKAEKQKSTIMQKSINHDLYFQAQTLMLVDEKLFNFWLTSVIEQGKAIADEMLIKEAITLSKNPYYQPCAK